ncbi:hypothetical protein A0256_15450 [Mucilaginibacter sp. PAMC 26640]|nr:hypothetical protein A0256_15450 [Mucilaginibacter sp. PAMC 26640]
MNNPFNDLKPEQVEGINERFHGLNSSKDFYLLLVDLLDILNVKDEEKEIFKAWITQFIRLRFPRRYTYFTIRKASGKDRIIHSPNDILKFIQRLFNLVLNTVFVPHPNSFGFSKSQSIRDNAAVHVNYNYVFNIDLIDFFTTIDAERIKSAFKESPFNLSGEKRELINHLVYLTCIPIKLGQDKENDTSIGTLKVLPQGAPTSPIISNIVCYAMDHQLAELADKFKINYTRYADDITFSSNRNLYQEGSKFRHMLESIVISQGFALNGNKTRLQKKHSRQVVTGLVVNERTNVNRDYIRSLRMYLHYWEKYGYQKAEQLYNKDVDTELFFGEPKSLFDLLKGRIDFLKMVKGADDNVYKNLKKRWLRLTNPDSRTIEFRDEYFNTHKPKDVANFLRLFQDSAGLKYLTHDFDTPGAKFSYEKIMDTANTEFSTGFTKYAITRALYARIKQFAFTERPSWWRWVNGEKSTYNLGWKSTKLKNWINENPGVHPIRFKIFRDELITPFKDSIQIRAPKFKELIENSIKEKFQDYKSEFNISFKYLETAEFYTDVDIIMGGIRHLFDGIIERLSLSNEIIISFKRTEINGRLIKVVEITHVNSSCFKEAKINDLLSGNFIEAKRAFQGLCNWSITASFADGNYKLNMLNDSDPYIEREPIASDEILGFTHSLYFY